MKKAFLILILASVLVPARALAAAAAALPPGIQKGATVEGITEYTLTNGLKVLLFPDPAKPSITVNVTYLVGSRNENYGETGMAHLLEHMVFKGTPRHRNIPQELAAHGADPNGSTGTDRTNYFETFSPARNNLDWALDMEADRMVNSFIAKKDLDTEMTVVRNEFESGENNPRRVLEERVLASAYLWHNYGKSTIGARSDIENVPIERLQAFYRNWYQPDNAVLVVAGDFDPAKALPLIKNKFGGIPRPRRVLQRTYTQEPVQDGERLVTLRRSGDMQEIRTAYHTPAAAHPDTAALNVLAYILGDTPSGRLYKALVGTKKAVSTEGYNEPMCEAGLIMFGARLRAETPLEEARDTLLRITEEASAGGFDAADVERARTALLKNADLALKSPDRLGIRLSESVADGDWRLFFIQRDRLKAVTEADVRRVAAQYLKSSNRTMGLFRPTEKPDRSEIPAVPDITALSAAYKGGAALAAGEAFDPSPKNIDRRTIHAALKNGLKLALLPKKNRGSSVRVLLSLNMGSEESLTGLGAVPGLTGSMLMRGTTRHTRQQIADEFDRLKTKARIQGGYVSLETDQANLAPALRLAAEVLREPSFPESEFATLKQEELAAVEARRKQPDYLAMNAFARHTKPYSPGDIRYTPTPEERIERLNAADLAAVKAYHKEFYGASSGQLALIGDFDPSEVKALAEELFGGWISPKPYKRLEYKYKEIVPAEITLETPDKANANMMLGLRFPMRDDNPDYPALQLANYMIGEGFLNSRLAVRIRQKDGLSYGVGSVLQASAEDEYGDFTAYAIFNPQNAARLEKDFREELERVISGGFSPDEVREARAGWLQERELERAQDGQLVSRLNDNEYLGRTMSWYDAQDKRIKALTPLQIQDAFRRHIRPETLTFVQAGDFAGAREKAAASETGTKVSGK